MSAHPEMPLDLYQVLEEEYLSLHGELSPEEEVTLNDHRVVARLDWKFHRGHIKNPKGLARKLRGGGAEMHELITHLRRLLPDLEKRLEPYSDERDLKTLEAVLEKALNEVLERDLHDPEAFKHVEVKDSTRELLRQCARTSRASGDEADDETVHANRLLLEETFPDELERILDIRLAAMYKRLHAKRHAALCLSGGGIRSGTFALGLLQGLARYNLLKKFDYLSTVSGGGYIGGWLSAWLHRHARGLAGVTADLDPTAPESKVDPDPPAIRHLRDYSNFIAPKKGLLTADTWSFIAIYLRNLFLNGLVLIPLLLALLALPRLNVSLLLSQSEVASFLSGFGYSFIPRYGFLAAGSLLLVLTITYIALNRPTVSEQLIDRSPFWRERRSQGWFLGLCLLPLVLAAFCLTTYWGWSSEAHAAAGDDDASRWPIFALFGVSIPLVAWLIASFILGRYRRENWKELKTDLGIFFLLILTGAIGGGLIRYTTKLFQNPIVHNPTDSWATEWYACLAAPGFLILILLATSFFVGLTSRGFFGGSELINDEDREWWARFNGWVLIAALAWALFSVLSIHGPRALFYAPKLLASVGGVAGLASLLGGFSSKSPATEEQANKGGLLKTVISNHMLPLAAFAFLVLFLTALSLLSTFILWAAADPVEKWGWYPLRNSAALLLSFDGVAHMLTVHHSALWYVAAFAVAGAVVGLVMAWRINLNRFSLHAGYRNRLIRAFLGASRARGERKANPFTGFDPEDNVQMHELRPVLFHEGDFENPEQLAHWVGKAEPGEPQDPDATEEESAAYATSQFIRRYLSEKVRAWLGDYTGTTPLPPRLRRDLIADLNKEILESERVVPSGAAPPQAVLADATAPQTPPSDQLIMRKRAALRAVYTNQIRPKYPPPHRLLHVVNTALNLVGGKNLAWQQRKAEPFAVTPLHAGCFRVGYRRSRDYGGEKGISLGTAQTISGAAASSNMGYYTTSPVLSLVLTLFNVRLGWWLGNPGPSGQKFYWREAPRLSVTPVVQEALGLTDDTNAYVYLTDGGHFENLALYEMVLRRCHLIVLSDGARDPKFEFSDLGNAVRKIRIDLGVPIEFDEIPIHAKAPEKERCGYWAFGRILYSKVDKGEEVRDGLLIYVKPTVYGGEPRDVIQYKASNPDFPHQSTGDQFFDEPQFESYKTLGWHIMNRMCANAFAPGDKPSHELDCAQFVHAALANYNKPCQPGKAEGDAPAKYEPEWLVEWLNEKKTPHDRKQGCVST